MFKGKIKGNLFSRKWLLLFALVIVLAIPVIIYAAINIDSNQQYRVNSQAVGFRIHPRLSDDVSVASTPVCFTNRSGKDYFIPNNSSSEVTKFLGAVEKSTVPGVSYLKVGSASVSWVGDSASSTGVCKDGLCMPTLGEDYATDPEDCCSASCRGKQCGDNQCGGDCAFYEPVGTHKDSSGYILYSSQQGWGSKASEIECYVFTSDGAAPTGAVEPHYYICSSGSFSGDGSATTCGSSTPTTPTVTASCHGDSVCITMPDSTSCDNTTKNSGGTHLCDWH